MLGLQVQYPGWELMYGEKMLNSAPVNNDNSKNPAPERGNRFASFAEQFSKERQSLPEHLNSQ